MRVDVLVDGWMYKPPKSVVAITSLLMVVLPVRAACHITPLDNANSCRRSGLVTMATELTASTVWGGLVIIIADFSPKLTLLLGREDQYSSFWQWWKDCRTKNVTSAWLKSVSFSRSGAIRSIKHKSKQFLLPYLAPTFCWPRLMFHFLTRSRICDISQVN